MKKLMKHKAFWPVVIAAAIVGIYLYNKKKRSAAVKVTITNKPDVPTVGNVQQGIYTPDVKGAPQQGVTALNVLGGVNNGVNLSPSVRYTQGDKSPVLIDLGGGAGFRSN